MQHIQVPHDMCEESFLDPTDVLVYACIKSFMGSATREAYPSIETITEDFGISKNTIIRSVKKLVENNDISIRKRGRSNVYKFNPNSKHFEMFTAEFIKDKSKSVNKRAYLIMLHQSMMEKETGIGKISYSNNELSKKIGLSTSTIRRRDNELKEDGILTAIPTKKRDFETGLPVDLKLFNLEMIGQAILYVNDKVEEHETKLIKQDKTNEILIREINNLRTELGKNAVSLESLIVGE